MNFLLHLLGSILSLKNIQDSETVGVVKLLSFSFNLSSTVLKRDKRLLKKLNKNGFSLLHKKGNFFFLCLLTTLSTYTLLHTV